MLNSTVRQPLKFRPKCFISEKIKTTFADRSYDGKIQRKSHVKSTGIVLSSSATVYNNTGWIISSIDTYNLETGYTYNVFGETTQTRRELVDGRWMVSERVYDSQGRVVFSTDSHVEGSADPIYGSLTIYDAQGRVEKTVRYVGCQVAIDADGSSTVVSYGSVLYQTSTEYDSKGRVKSSTDAYGNVTTYEYDNLDRQVKVNHSTGLVTQTIYDTQGRVSETRIINGSEIRTTKYVYDMFGNIVKTVQPDGTTIQAEYNDKGQKISETNQLGQVRYFEYDDLGQLTKVILPEAGGAIPVYQYTYDAQGNQTSIIDPNGNVTKFTYDTNGNQLTRTLPDGSMEAFEYDKFGRLAKQTSFEGVVTQFIYDGFGRLATKLFYENQTTYLAGTPAETWTYTYDTLGRVTKIDQNGRVTQTVYDAQGRTVSIQTPEGEISYTYDEFGRQASVQTDNDPPTSYTCDQFGRLATVSSDGITTRYEYDAYGNLAATRTSNGVTTTYEYDNMNRLKRLLNFVDANNDGIWNNGEARISQFDYDLDDLGRKIQAEEWFGNGNLQKNTINWSYDDAGRLIEEIFDHYDDDFDQTLQWDYDLVGNRLQQRLDKGSDGVWDAFTHYNYDANDRLLMEIFDDLTAENKDRITTYGYDKTQQTSKAVTENGILVSETAFEYDAQGRMVVVTITAGNRTEKTVYEYGADGIRVSSEHEIWEDDVLVSKTRTEYLNDPLSITGYSQVLKTTEFDSEGNIEKTMTYVIGHQRISQIVADKDSSRQEHYFTFDGHGSTRVLTDFLGASAQLYSFDAYGNALGFNPSGALTEFLYSGEQFDAKIGQQYLRARYYDPATGRFNRLDPFFGNHTDPQSFHNYLYTHADPVNGIDPSGNFFCSVSVLSSAGIQGHMRVGIGYLQTAFRVYNTIGKFFQLIEYGKQISTLYKFAKTTLDLSSAGTPLPSALLTAITQTLNFDTGLSNLNKLFSIFDDILPNIAQSTGGNAKKIFEKLLEDIVKKIPQITTAVMQNVTKIAQIEMGRITYEDFVFVIGLPSPPTGFTHNMHGFVSAKIHGEDYAIGWSEYSGVLFDLGIAVKNPKSPAFKNSFPLWALGNYQSIARLDYWDYNNTWEYHPHYHAWGEKSHHYLDQM